MNGAFDHHSCEHGRIAAVNEQKRSIETHTLIHLKTLHFIDKGYS